MHSLKTKKGNPNGFPLPSVVPDYYFPANVMVVFPLTELVLLPEV